MTAAPAAPADTATTSSGSGAGSGARVVTGKPSGDLSGEKSRVLFSAGEDVDTGWKGKYQKSTVERNPDQYEAFASPWSKTSQFKLDNLRFCEISLDIVYAVEVFDRKDLMHTFENVSTGSDIAAWLCDHVEGMDTPLEAQQVGQELLNCGIYLPCNPDRIFKCESGSFYRPLVRFLPLFCVGISSYFAIVHCHEPAEDPGNSGPSFETRERLEQHRLSGSPEGRSRRSRHASHSPCCPL